MEPSLLQRVLCIISQRCWMRARRVCHEVKVYNIRDVGAGLSSRHCVLRNVSRSNVSSYTYVYNGNCKGICIYRFRSFLDVVINVQIRWDPRILAFVRQVMKEENEKLW